MAEIVIAGVGSGDARSGARDQAVRLAQRFVLLMAGTSILDLAFTFALLAISEHDYAIGTAFAANFVFLISCNGLIAWELFTPVRRAIAGDGPLEPGLQRLNRLPMLASRAVFLVGLAHALTVFVSGAFVVEAPVLKEMSHGYLLAAFLWYGFAFAAYFACYAYFAANDCAMAARQVLSRRGAIDDSQLPGSLMPKLWVAVAMLAVMPPLVIVLDLTVFAQVRALQGLNGREAVLLDLLGTLVAGAITIAFVARMLIEPLGQLKSAVARVADGRLEEPAPISGDDELGRITAHFNQLAKGLRERETIRRVFGKYVTPAVAVRILESATGNTTGRLHGELREATILFTDIEGFTTLAEQLTPSQTIDLLNDYFTALEAIITEHGGTVLAFIGDAVYASFNVPEPHPDHCTRAVKAAFEIARRLERRTFGHGVVLRTRVGVHTGEVVAGSVGSEDRLGYTLYGDAVNVAMRLEQLNKELGTMVTVSETVVAGCEPEVVRACGLVQRGSVGLRGRAAPVAIYVIDALPRDETSPA